MKVIRFFNHSAAALLLALATAMFIANWASAGLVQPREPVFMVSMRILFWTVGTIELCVALFCLLGRQDGWKAAMVLWLAMNLVIYQAGFVWSGEHRNFSIYLFRLAQAFAIAPNTAYLILIIAVLYLLSGSSIALLCFRQEGRATLPNNLVADSFKISCPACGGHIKFAAENLGQRIPCPHCQNNVTLRKPEENLKMSCFFCKEHIAFPTHALGEKIKCPHCKMEITLKEAT